MRGYTKIILQEKEDLTLFLPLCLNALQNIDLSAQTTTPFPQPPSFAVIFAAWHRHCFIPIGGATQSLKKKGLELTGTKSTYGNL